MIAYEPMLQRTDNMTSDLLQQLTVFGQHYNNSLLSDVILEADHQQIHAHRVVLASQSACFKAVFEVGFCISTQVICGCNNYTERGIVLFPQALLYICRT